MPAFVLYWILSYIYTIYYLTSLLLLHKAVACVSLHISNSRNLIHNECLANISSHTSWIFLALWYFTHATLISLLCCSVVVVPLSSSLFYKVDDVCCFECISHFMYPDLLAIVYTVMHISHFLHCINIGFYVIA